MSFGMAAVPPDGWLVAGRRTVHRCHCTSDARRSGSGTPIRQVFHPHRSRATQHSRERYPGEGRYVRFVPRPRAYHHTRVLSHGPIRLRVEHYLRRDWPTIEELSRDTRECDAGVKDTMYLGAEEAAGVARAEILHSVDRLHPWDRGRRRWISGAAAGPCKGSDECPYHGQHRQRSANPRAPATPRLWGVFIRNGDMKRFSPRELENDSALTHPLADLASPSSRMGARLRSTSSTISFERRQCISSCKRMGVRSPWR
jgi:hypothetical protein